MYTPVLIVMLLVSTAFLISVAATTDGAPNFNVMKMKEIKRWLSNRDLECSTCVSKEDFVEFCKDEFARGNQPSSNERVSAVQMINGEFWDSWSDLALSLCRAQCNLNSKDEPQTEDATAMCDTIQSATRLFFMRVGKRTASSLKKSTKDLLRTSVKSTYLAAGRRLLTRLIQHCKSGAAMNSCQSVSKVISLMEDSTQSAKIKSVAGASFSEYLSNVGIENTNPMFEIVNNKRGLKRDEL